MARSNGSEAMLQRNGASLFQANRARVGGWADVTRISWYSTRMRHKKESAHCVARDSQPKAVWRKDMPERRAGLGSGVSVESNQIIGMR